ncbi:MAG: GNAT family N-acetyltransferase [Flavobacterium sp.]|jgi:GNAT superfamily N-acetyltransferase|nr:GNAT family N-acetyltransferase [Flavobacterium sp.]
MIEIKKITAFETIIVRHPVLRPGRPIESCHFDGDDMPTTSHFGLFLENQLAGVISAFKAQNKLFSEENQYQIRGMAVLSEFQKKGFGEQLLQYCENEIRLKSGNLIWFNARETALGFYEKSGYEILGDQFEIPNVGPHYILFKAI